MQRLSLISRQRGLTLIEMLVTVFILSVGLLGMAGLQSRLQQSEMEAYQRSQALLLLADMANRIATNRSHAANYITSIAGIGVGMTCETSTATQQLSDSGEWCEALQGAGETTGTGSSKVNVGAMLGGRGCVESLGSNQYRISVAWQGLTPLSAPTSTTCGADSYDGATGTLCHDDLCRRVVTTTVTVANLK